MSTDTIARGDVWTTRLLTGRAAHINFATPTDLSAVQTFYDHLDDTSTSTRFFGIRRHIPIDELRATVGTSPTHVTLLAWSDGRLVGIGEYIVTPYRLDAEVAFAVADDHHREGIATLLLERLAVIAHERGILRLTARVLRDNHDMHLVFNTVGLTAHTTDADGAVLVTLDLSSITPMRTAAATRTASIPHRPHLPHARPTRGPKVAPDHRPPIPTGPARTGSLMRSAPSPPRRRP
jgi:GNAT superfamily N-acetyltransferase